LLANGYLDAKERRVMYYHITTWMCIFCWIDLKTITKSNFHIQFNNTAFSALISNFILNLLNHHEILGSDAPDMFIAFNGLIFVVTVIVLLAAKQHGYFKHRYEND